MDYKKFLEERAKSGIVLGLGEMRALMERLGNPQESIKIIHIAGTNGKGSVGAFLEGILRQKKYKVARYTSPAVFDEFEKYTINSLPISEEEYISCIEKIAGVIGDGINPTLFEVETAIAFLYFAEKDCDYAIIETGMGGKEDATNITENPVCSILTPISMDHMAFLGDTIEKIAKEKAAIIKQECPAVSAFQKDSVTKVIKERAKEMNSHLVFAKEYSYKGFDGARQYFDYDEIKDLSICALGLYQIQNAALAIEAANVIGDFSEEEIKNGIKDIIWRGRFEVISKNPLFIIDGAHNEGGARALRETVVEYFGGRRINFITATFRDKEYEKTTAALAPLGDKVYAVATDHPRALDPQAYAKTIQIHNKSTRKSTISDAVRECMADTEAITICFGTLSFLSEIKKEVIKNTPSSMERADRVFSHPLYKELLAATQQAEKDRIYCRHGFEHAMDTARIAYILALEERAEIRKDVIYAAALLHDLGRCKEYQSGKRHADESADLAHIILPGCGFLKEEIKEIVKAIRAHQDAGGSGLSSLLQRADKLSRMCMRCESISSCKWSEDKFNMNILY